MHHKDDSMATKFRTTCPVSFVTNTTFRSNCMTIVKFEYDRTHKTQAWIIQCGKERQIIDWKFKFHSFQGCRHYSSYHPTRICNDTLTVWRLHNILAVAYLSNTFTMTMKITKKMHYIYIYIYINLLFQVGSTCFGRSFRAKFSPIIRSIWLYLQYLVVYT